MIEVDYSPPQKRVFDVAIKTNSMTGTYSDVRDLLTHFDQTTSFAEVPLEGNICLTQEGGAFNLAFRPSGCKVEGSIHGKMVGGKLESPLAGIELKNINFNFDYDHDIDQLHIKNLTGALHLNDEQDAAFAIKEGYVHFTDLKTKAAAFDLPLLTGSREIFRLAGSTEPLSQEDRGSLLQFVIDKKTTHYGGVNPDRIELTMNDGCEVDAFDLQWSCSLGSFFGNLHKLGAVALETYAPNLVKPWKEMDTPSGEVTISIQYDNPNKQFNFRLEGHNVQSGETRFKHVVFAGVKKRQAWSIEQLQMDKIAVAADIVPHQDGYKVNFLGLRYGNVLLMGLEGFCNIDKASFDGTINLMEVDFSKLGQWKSFHQLVGEYHPRGEMKGSGSLHISMNDQWPPHIKADLKAMVRNSELRGTAF